MGQVFLFPNLGGIHGSCVYDFFHVDRRNGVVSGMLTEQTEQRTIRRKKSLTPGVLYLRSSQSDSAPGVNPWRTIARTKRS